MSEANNAMLSGNSPLFAIKGQVAVHYLDGSVVEGEFVTQDPFNIFVNVEGEAVLIPRVQIKWIKGLSGQPIEPDQSQGEFVDKKDSGGGPEQPVHTETKAAEEFDQAPIAEDDDEDDTTFIIPDIDIQIKIWDFDFACIDGIIENNKVNSDWTKKININRK